MARDAEQTLDSRLSVCPVGQFPAAVASARQTVRKAESLPPAAVAGPLQSLVRRAARMRERVTITDHDEPTAVVISAGELEDLKDALAVAEARVREARGETRRIPHAEVKRLLSIEK